MKYLKCLLLFGCIFICTNLFSQSISANITSPLTLTSYSIGADVNFTASVTDTVGSISTVSFYEDSIYLGDGYLDGNGLWDFTWYGVAQGSYSVTVVATDNLNNTQTSAAVIINVNVIQTPYTFDNGLTAYGNYVFWGGTAEQGLNINFPPGQGNYYQSVVNSYGNLKYDNMQGQFAYSNYDNDLGNENGFVFDAPTNHFELYSGFSTEYPSPTGYYVSIYGTAGGYNNEPGINLVVVGGASQDLGNGIQIYPGGMDLNTPIIQLNHFPNSPNMDSVLVTDSLGNLTQKAMSAFGSGGHWNLNGNTTYDTLDNIGIGTANPQSKLAVNGTITALKVKVTQTGWADYVFDSAYTLPPLEEVQKYILANKHLQDIPSSAEVKCNGIDLGNNQAALLKKVEELTLYIIEQNKKSDEQDKRIKDLEEKLNKLLSGQNLLK